MNGNIRVRDYAHIDEVDPTIWDALVPEWDVQTSHRFVKVCQDSGVENARYRHLLIEQGGRPAAIASLSLMDVRLDLLAPRGIRGAIAGLRRAWPKLLRVPTLLGGLPVSFGRSCMRFAPWADTARCIAAVREAADATADEWGAGLIAFKEYSATECEQLDALRDDADYVRAHSLPGCRLPIRWDSVDAYESDMRASYRRQLRKTREAAHQAGLRIREVPDFAPFGDRIFSLYEQVMERAELQLERLNRSFFDELGAAFGTRAPALLAEQDGEIVAAAVLLMSGDACYFLSTGIDYARARGCSAYLQLVAEVVRFAIRRRARFLELGQTSYDLKRRLGALPDPRYVYLKYAGALGHRALRATHGYLFPERSFEPRRVFGAP